MHCRIGLLIAGLGWLLAQSAMAGGAPLLPDSWHGAHRVGMRLVQQYDPSRFSRPAFDMVTGQPTVGPRLRPVQTLVWYPAASGPKPGGQPLTYRDYAQTRITQQQFSFAPDPYRALLTGLPAQELGRLPPEEARGELERPMRARRNAPPAAGRFPLIVYAPGAGSEAHDNIELCEFLASHGYWVMASASNGAYARGMTLDREGVEAQMRDIQFLIAHASSLPQVDTSRVAVIGASLGASAGLLAAAQDERIKALVALDGAFRYHPELTENIAWLKPARINAPLLFMAAGERSQDPKAREELQKQGDNSWLKKLKHADFYQLTMEPMLHGSFAGMLLRRHPAAQFEGFSKPQMIQAYGHMARYGLQFVNAYLKQDAAALTFLKNPPQQNGAPEGWLKMEHRPGSGPFPTLEQLAVEAARRGYAELPALYAAAQAKAPEFKPAEVDIHLWGQALLEANKLNQAIEVFKLNTQVYPEQPWNHIILAQAFLQAKNQQAAQQSLQQALKLDPNHPVAAARLKALQAEAGKAEK